MSDEPKTIQAVHLERLAGAYDPAPDGYEWAILAKSDPLSAPSRVLMCMTCSALVGVHEGHTAWHEWVRQGRD